MDVVPWQQAAALIADSRGVRRLLAEDASSGLHSRMQAGQCLL
jgi:hypothetical protein